MVVLKMANKYAAVNSRLFALSLTPRPLLYRESDRTPCQCSKLRKPYPEAVLSLARHDCMLSSSAHGSNDVAGAVGPVSTMACHM